MTTSDRLHGEAIRFLTHYYAALKESGNEEDLSATLEPIAEAVLSLSIFCRNKIPKLTQEVVYI